MKRYNAVYGGVYDNSVMVEEHDGDWVWYEDVEEMQSKCAELLEALKAIVYEIEQSNWGIKSPAQYETTAFVAARAAIAKAEGSSNE